MEFPGQQLFDLPADCQQAFGADIHIRTPVVCQGTESELTAMTPRPIQKEESTAEVQFTES